MFSAYTFYDPLFNHLSSNKGRMTSKSSFNSKLISTHYNIAHLYLFSLSLFTIATLQLVHPIRSTSTRNASTSINILFFNLYRLSFIKSTISNDQKADSADIFVMLSAYILMHGTFVNLFLSMRKFGSKVWLGEWSIENYQEHFQSLF